MVTFVKEKESVVTFVAERVVATFVKKKNTHWPHSATKIVCEHIGEGKKYSVPAFVNETNSWSHSVTCSFAVVIFVNKDRTRLHSKVRNIFIRLF